jgi:hypothetical protein
VPRTSQLASSLDCRQPRQLPKPLPTPPPGAERPVGTRRKSPAFRESPANPPNPSPTPQDLAERGLEKVRSLGLIPDTSHEARFIVARGRSPGATADADPLVSDDSESGSCMGNTSMGNLQEVFAAATLATQQPTRHLRHLYGLSRYPTHMFALAAQRSWEAH